MEVVEQIGIPLGADHVIVNHILTESEQSRAGLQPLAISKATDTSIEVYKATESLLRSDHSRFDKFIEEPHNYYAVGVEKYSKTLQEAYRILKNYKFDAQNYQTPINNTSGGMDFINNGHGIMKDTTKITLWNCQKKVHYENDCPDKKTGDSTDTDASRKSDSTNMTNGIWYATVMLQEGVHDGEFYGKDMFSAFSFFNAGHEPIKPYE